MRGKSAAEILKAADSAKGHFGEETSAPIVDGWVLPDDPASLFEKGMAHDVPLLTGSNADEVGGILGDFVVRGHYREYADAILKLFPGKSRNRAGTVAIFSYVARADARAMSRHKSRAYLYQFTRVAPPWRFLGAFHSSEICYVFGNLDAKLAFEARDRELSRTMMAYWVRFAACGDPNGQGLPPWPPYDAKTDVHLELGDIVRSGKGLEKIACDGIDQVCAERIKHRKAVLQGATR
jgi:para-nitrobenzyl esterase